jgi:hypothetical protein
MTDTRRNAARIELSEFVRDDIPRLIGWIRSPEELAAWAGAFFAYPLDEAQLERYLQSSTGENPPRRRIFKAVDVMSCEAIGHIELSHIWPHLSGRVSRVLVGDPAHRGRHRHRHGPGPSAARVRRVLVPANQFGGRRCQPTGHRRYRRAGFAHVGTWPQAMTTAAGVIDVYWMSIASTAPLERGPTRRLPTQSGDSDGASLWFERAPAYEARDRVWPAGDACPSTAAISAASRA